MAPPQSLPDDQVPVPPSKTQLPAATTKLPQLPQGLSSSALLDIVPNLLLGASIRKRPLPRLLKPASQKTQLIYVSASTPLMVVVKRVRKRLDRSVVGSYSTKNMSLGQRVEALKKHDASGQSSEVLVIGTGRAIEKVLSVASWFEARGDCVVEVKTRTVGVVDEVVIEDGEDGGDRARKMSALEVGIRLQ